MLREEEVEQLTKMMNWGEQHPDIKKIRVEIAPNHQNKSLVTIQAEWHDKKVANGCGFTLTEAMRSFSTFSHTVIEAEKVFK